MNMRELARETIEEMRDGICWLAVWKENKTWQYQEFWPMDVDDTEPIFEPEDMPRLAEIHDVDEKAIMVNSFYSNIGPYETMTIRSLQDGLAWTYNSRLNNLSRYL